MRESGVTDRMLRSLVAWANERDEIRATLLTSTRAVPNAVVDALSDYDVIIVVRDITPFMADHSWIETFGDVLVAYWDPVEVDTEVGIERSGNVVQYADGLKIDFSVWPVALLEAIGQLPLPHPSGVSHWLNDPINRACHARAIAELAACRERLGL